MDLKTAEHNSKLISFRIDSEDELLKAFRPKDQKAVQLPKGIVYPRDVEHYFAWKENSGVYTYLVFQKRNFRKLWMVEKRNIAA